MVSYFIAGIAFLLALWFIISIALKFKPKYRALFKSLAGVGFVATGVCAYIESSGASLLSFLLVLFGLLFGMVGDFMLAMREVKKDKEQLFLLLGIIGFAIGHILYVVFYATLCDITFWQPLIAMGLAIVIMIAAQAMKMNFGKMTIPVFIYAFIILLMLSCSISTIILLPITTATIVLNIGAILFVISDMILCFIFFKEKMPKILGVFNLVTYFSAQILIALSLLFL